MKGFPDTGKKHKNKNLSLIRGTQETFLAGGKVMTEDRGKKKKLSEPRLERQGHCHCYPKSYSEEGSWALLVLGNVETPPKTYTVNCLGMKSQQSLPKL